MTEHRIAFAFSELSQRRFNQLAVQVDEFVNEWLSKHIGEDAEYEVFCEPGGPAAWPSSDVGVRLNGIRAERAKRSG